MTKLKFSVIAILFCLSSVFYSEAHPPQEIKASYDFHHGIVKVFVAHETARPASHYIKWITAFSGDTRAMQEFSIQDDEQGQRTSFYFPGLSTGTVIGIRAECSIQGIKEESIMVKLPEEKSEIEFQTIEKGSYSGIAEKRTLIITNHFELQKIWSDLYANRYPVPDIPQIDFEKNILAAVFIGEKPTGGYSVNIDNVYFENGRIRILYSYSEPSTDSIVTQAITSPFYIVVFPAPDEIKETVFEEYRR